MGIKEFLIKRKKSMLMVVIAAVAFVGGVIAHQMSGTIDSPLEQAAEEVLAIEGINIDFSAEEKKQKAAPVGVAAPIDKPADAEALVEKVVAEAVKAAEAIESIESIAAPAPQAEPPASGVPQK